MIVLTFDSDWAPQFVIDHVIAFMKDAGVKGTFFLTSPYTIPVGVHLETGIHPNFMSDSTQGSSISEVLKVLKSWYPEAVGSRSHRFYWHSGLEKKLADKGIMYDSSILLPFHPYLEPFRIDSVMRFPVWWSDGLHLLSKLPSRLADFPNVHKPGLKVVNFHPIHIYLNTKDLGEYRKMMRQVQSYGESQPGDLSHFRQSGYGIRTVFTDVVKYVKEYQDETVCLKDLLSISHK